jgi:Zinc-finger associated domain (zf-AD)
MSHQDLCRCCLAEAKSESDLYEFSSEVSMEVDTASDPQNFVKISECFKQLTSISVPDESQDSSKICTQCLGDLKFCFMFQQKCWESDKVYSEESPNDGKI